MQEPKTEEIVSLVEAVTKNTFDILKAAYKSQKESNPAGCLQEAKTRIIFPKYRNGSCRISEQELRFVFVEQLNKYLDENGPSGIYYSVEMPTENLYKFLGKKGRSARTDLTLHNSKFKRICIIEFKGNNKKYDTDIIKLKLESCELKYFIQIVENIDRLPIQSLEKITSDMQESGIRYHCCYCIDNSEMIDVEQNKQQD